MTALGSTKTWCLQLRYDKDARDVPICLDMFGSIDPPDRVTKLSALSPEVISKPVSTNSIRICSVILMGVSRLP